MDVNDGYRLEGPQSAGVNGGGRTAAFLPRLHSDEHRPVAKQWAEIAKLIATVTKR